MSTLPTEEVSDEQKRHIELLKSDFRNFLFVMWQHLRLPTPTKVQYDIALYLQHGPRRRVIEAFRGVGKSWITAAYVLWLLFRDHNERILVVSASKDRADAFSTFVKRLINEMPLLQYLAPRNGQRDANVAFDVGPSDPHQAASVRSVGITGQMTGGRATHIIADDIEIPKNSMTALMRERIAELVKEFDAILVPNGCITYLGTPQTEMSLYNRLPERGYNIRIWPARYPDKKRTEGYAGHLAPKIASELVEQGFDPKLVGKPTDPARFTNLDLMEREASYGRSGFALQFMLDTSLSDAERYPLKLSDLIVMDITPDLGPSNVVYGSHPDQLMEHLPAVGFTGDRYFRPMFVAKDFLPYQGRVLAIDPSGRGSDETGYAVVYMLNGFLFVAEAGGLKGGYDDATLSTLAEIAKRNKVNEVIVESNFGDGMFTKLLTPFLVRKHPVTVTEVRSSVQKEKRIIDVLEPVMNQHRLIMNERIIKDDFNGAELGRTPVDYQLFHQMTRITKERGSLSHDDRLDALSMAVAYWVEQMDKDVARNDAENRARLQDAELAKFMEHCLGTETDQNVHDSWDANV